MEPPTPRTLEASKEARIMFRAMDLDGNGSLDSAEFAVRARPLASASF